MHVRMDMRMDVHMCSRCACGRQAYRKYYNEINADWEAIVTAMAFVRGLRRADLCSSEAVVWWHHGRFTNPQRYPFNWNFSEPGRNERDCRTADEPPCPEGWGGLTVYAQGGRARRACPLQAAASRRLSSRVPSMYAYSTTRIKLVSSRNHRTQS